MHEYDSVEGAGLRGIKIKIENKLRLVDIASRFPMVAKLFKTLNIRGFKRLK